jgi:transcriptional regulator with XRE-family HTH domain
MPTEGHGELLRKWREQRGFTVSALARAAGVSRDQVRGAEQGRQPKLGVFLRVAAVLNLDRKARDEIERAAFKCP